MYTFFSSFLFISIQLFLSISALFMLLGINGGILFYSLLLKAGWKESLPSSPLPPSLATEPSLPPPQTEKDGPAPKKVKARPPPLKKTFDSVDK